ncbi:hypothetical protein TSUD_62970 [Trifolium subterraneum]|uniref:NADP-dependent oxidoreductase domain-containing protein n=1 Tax=Trifolium subterraneum TaxID=3900 RepID=A0A2Z6MLD2_TRISU|nr:hypothetical protein TSUD_62970 [Trifolium subterraneum]
MEVKKVPEVVLNSGKTMPTIGFGTGTIPPSQTLLDAIDIGYRHFDTASFYNTEEPLGQAMSKSLELGLIKNRDELFITSKLWCTDAHHDLLGLAYVDLYLIHWPVRLKQDVEGINFKGEDVIPFDIKETWEAMEDCYRLGLAKSIGVSNFGIKKLSTLLENAEIPPAINQIALRWIYEQGAIPVVKSFNKERMKQNIEIFDWELDQEESDKINQIPQCRLLKAEMFLSDNGPYKSLEELWDGDV